VGFGRAGFEASDGNGVSLSREIQKGNLSRLENINRKLILSSKKTKVSLFVSIEYRGKNPSKSFFVEVIRTEFGLLLSLNCTCG